MVKRRLFPTVSSGAIHITANDNGKKDYMFKALSAKVVKYRAYQAINAAGKRAKRIAQNPNHSPFKTGALIKSIRWDGARNLKTKVGNGYLSVNVPYGAYQEYHPTGRKSRFLFRALMIVQPELEAKLRKLMYEKDAVIKTRAKDFK